MRIFAGKSTEILKSNFGQQPSFFQRNTLMLKAAYDSRPRQIPLCAHHSQTIENDTILHDTHFAFQNDTTAVLQSQLLLRK
jgi:hypothetical protein